MKGGTVIKTEIKTLVKENLAAVSEIEKECFLIPWSMETLVREFENGCLFSGAFYNGELAGFVSVKIVGTEAFICNLAVKNEFRRMGVGSALILSLCDFAKGNKLDFLTLEVRKSNLSAQNLYMKSGFKNVGIRPGFYSDPKEDAIIFTKKDF